MSNLQTNRPPNIIIIFCDNLGYGDLGCFGSQRNRTPNIDRLAAEGLKFTHFCSTSGVCSPSRASLLTGCYPRRVNMQSDEAGRLVLFPGSSKGLNPKEITIADMLHARGYATACIGKWHLGDAPEFLPTRQGFDEFLGVPYSEDMIPERNPSWPPLPLLQNETILEAPVDPNTLTNRYTETSIDFIERNKKHPFFLYLPHAMPGSSEESFSSEAFRGHSNNGRYGDAVEEIDASTGRILDTLKRLDLDEQTLVVWTTDHGSVDRNHGSNLPLKGWGYDTSEGAMRIPCLMRWPNTIPAGCACHKLAATIDLLPTIAHLTGARPPAENTIDGKCIQDLMLNVDNAPSPHEAFYYYFMEQLQAVRAGKWKLYLPLEGKWVNSKRKKEESPSRLYNLNADISEEINLADQHPEIVERLLALAEAAREELGDEDRVGAGQRPAGKIKATAV